MRCGSQDCPNQDPFVIAVVHVKGTDTRLPACELCLAGYLRRRDSGESIGVYWMATG
jgi:hypothetical protein